MFHSTIFQLVLYITAIFMFLCDFVFFFRANFCRKKSGFHPKKDGLCELKFQATNRSLTIHETFAVVILVFLSFPLRGPFILYQLACYLNCYIALSIELMVEIGCSFCFCFCFKAMNSVETFMGDIKIIISV